MPLVTIKDPDPLPRQVAEESDLLDQPKFEELRNAGEQDEEEEAKQELPVELKLRMKQLLSTIYTYHVRE